MGYIKLDRKIQEWGWFGEPEMLALWVHLLLKANWAEKEWRGEVIPRGTFITSTAQLAAECGLTKGQVTYALSKLKAGGEIELESNNRFTKICIVKYEQYQGDSDSTPQAQQPQPAPAPPPGEKPKAKRTPRQIETLNLPFQSEAFLTAWEALCKQPKWKGKSLYALQLSLNKIARYDEAFAIEQIYLAIERDWQGLVFSSTDRNYAEWQRKNGKTNQNQPQQNNTSTGESTEQDGFTSTQYGGFTVEGYKRRKW